VRERQRLATALDLGVGLPSMADRECRVAGVTEASGNRQVADITAVCGFGFHRMWSGYTQLIAPLTGRIVLWLFVLFIGQLDLPTPHPAEGDTP
jgi:hypothetical protein